MCVYYAYVLFLYIYLMVLTAPLSAGVIWRTLKPEIVLHIMRSHSSPPLPTETPLNLKNG